MVVLKEKVQLSYALYCIIISNVIRLIFFLFNRQSSIDTLIYPMVRCLFSHDCFPPLVSCYLVKPFFILLSVVLLDFMYNHFIVIFPDNWITWLYFL
jgi:hypothetical protein